jgi:hypothetical protein
MFLPQKFKLTIFCLIIVIAFLLASPAVFATDASGVTNALYNLNNTAKTGGIETTSQKDLPTIIGKVVGAVLAFTGVVFFCLILWAGMGWMLAKGNEEEINKAKETIFGAVLGLLVVLGAYAITKVIAELISNATK